MCEGVALTFFSDLTGFSVTQVRHNPYADKDASGSLRRGLVR